MKKLAVVLFFSFFSLLAQAEIQVQVEPNQVNLGDVFHLTLTQEDPQNGGVPDLTVLQKDFVIIGTERSVNYSIINGITQSASQWIVTLRAKNTGTLNIPAIKIGIDQSAPTSIKIEPGLQTQDSQYISSKQQDVFLEAEVNEKESYVNQQIIYTVKLYNSKRLLDAEYQGPQVEDALLIPLGDANRYQKIINNVNYVVEEQNYAIFPQKKGTLKITSPIFSALVYDFDPQRIKAQAKTIELTVRPIPSQFKGKNWLPAKQVKLTEQYENSNQKMSQGSTLTRTITLEGIGIPAQLLPSLNFGTTDLFSVYPEKGADRNQVTQGELVGSTEIKVTYLFNKPGKVIIPELKLPWFNIQTGKEEIAVLPPRSMDITLSASAAPGSESQSGVSNNTSETQLPQVATEPAFKSHNNWPWIIAIIFALAWLFTIALWAWQKHSRNIGKGKYKAALDALNKACNECDPAKTRDALLYWAALHWPDAPMLNLTDLTKLVRDAHLKKQLNLLSQVLYRSEQKTLWRGDELWRSIQVLQRASPRAKRKANPLPPINPF